MAGQMEPVMTAGSYSTEEHKEPQIATVLEKLRATVGGRRQSKLSDLWPAPVLETAPPPMDAAPEQERAMGATPRTGLPLDVEGTVHVELYDIDERSYLEEDVITFDSSTKQILEGEITAVLVDNIVRMNVEVKDDCVNTPVLEEQAHSASKPAPSVREKLKTGVTGSPSDVLCKPDKRGRCKKHGCEGITTKVSSKKWKDRGGGRGYGWVHYQSKKFLCKFRKSTSGGTDVDSSVCLHNYPADGQTNNIRGLTGISEHVDYYSTFTREDTAD